MRSLILLLILSFKAHATSWYVEDLLFNMPDDLYHSAPHKVQEASRKIKKHVDFLLKNYFPSYQLDVIFTFESTEGVDALFYPPHHYQGAMHLPIDRPVISLNPRIMFDSKVFRLVGHELFHAVHHRYAPHELSWIKEGLAQKFEAEVYGGITHSHVRAAMEDSRHALEENFDIKHVVSERYGNTFLFFHFMEQQCDIDRVWSYFLQPQEIATLGRDSINFVLSQLNRGHPHCQRAIDLMGHFTMAKLINLKGAEFPRALWPFIRPMDLMHSEAYALALLTPSETQQFIERLPPFLGLKLPVNIWTPSLTSEYLKGQGIVLKRWRTIKGVGTLLDWNGEALNEHSGEFILLYKKR